MTNEQTAVMIKGYLHQLIEAKEEVERLLPDTLRSCGRNILHQKTTWFDQTQPLRDMIDRLEEDIINLGSGEV